MVRAYDPDTLEPKWEFKMTDITWGGVLTTAGDLVFGGGREGYFLALDARTGELLWRESLGGQINAGAMSYAVERQAIHRDRGGQRAVLVRAAGRIGAAMAQRDVLELDIDELRPGRYQPRLHLREESLAELAESIREQGVLQPLIVRVMPAEHAAGGATAYEIVAGERRWRAARLAGLATVPVIVRELTDQSALAVALIENLQREDLNPIDKARSMARLIEEFDLTHDEIAKALGRSRTSVTNFLRLLDLADDVQDAMVEGTIDMGHARALLPLDHERQAVARSQDRAPRLVGAKSRENGQGAARRGARACENDGRDRHANALARAAAGTRARRESLDSRERQRRLRLAARVRRSREPRRELAAASRARAADPRRGGAEGPRVSVQELVHAGAERT